MTMRIALLLCAALLMSGCAGKTGLNDFRVSMGFISAYDAAVDDFKQGEVMAARVRLLSVKKDHEDYKKARRFLNHKVNPARLKLLRYYARKGKSEEKEKRWAQAEVAYKAAAALSRSPKALLGYQKNMNIKARQLRAKSIFAQRLEEDEIWMLWLDSYNPPHGLLGDDATFVAAREMNAELLEKRMEDSLVLANQYKDSDTPELTWVYADSYLRLKPDSQKAGSLKLTTENNLSNTFDFSDIAKTMKKKKRVQTSAIAKRKVKKADVEKLVAKGEWVQAKKSAQILRRQGNADADQLLKYIQQEMALLAAKAYEEGNLAFRLEQIGEAVAAWKEAVRLMPSEQTYVDSLNKGQQIQERLSALKAEESASEKDVSIEE
ncbi:MAG: hypothetical protein R8M46_02330 [Ghiorsea sp.]